MPLDLATCFKILGDPVRLTILEMLLEPQTLCANDIEQVLKLSQPAISHHMKLLIQSGLIQRRKQGKWVFYQLNPETFTELHGYLSKYSTPSTKELTMTRANILFLCTGNSARSQMAEAWLRHYGGEVLEVHSAGLEPSTLNPYTLKVMAEKGIDMSSHYAKSVKEFLGTKVLAYVITVCSHAEDRCPSAFLAGPKREHWPFEDPAAFVGSDDEKTNKFREIRDAIDVKVREWLDFPNGITSRFVLPMKTGVSPLNFDETHP